MTNLSLLERSEESRIPKLRGRILSFLKVRGRFLESQNSVREFAILKLPKSVEYERERKRGGAKAEFTSTKAIQFIRNGFYILKDFKQNLTFQ